MALDPYALCPCGSGKKLKFCCSDLAPDIEKVQKMIAGDQPHAALKHVEKLLEKQPDRASLLDLKANLELSMHEFEAAGKTIEHYLAVHPKNPAAHGQRAVLLAATEAGSTAIGPLQDALELLENDMPLRVFEAIGAVGHALLLEGELIAARGHLLLYAGIAPEDDNLALELLLRMNLQAGLPLLMREHLVLHEAPHDAAWKVEFDHAMKAAGRGQWRAAEGIFSSLRDKVGAAPAIVYNLAVVRGWLGNIESFAKGLHEFARLDVPEHQAIEAEALAQLIDPNLSDPTLETVRIAYAVKDEDNLSERLLADKRVEDYPIDESKLAEDAPRPRSTFILLDRPVPSASPDLTRPEIPRVLGFLSLYGKRTDRDAQLELTTDRNQGFEAVKSLLADIASDTLGEILEEEVVAEKSLTEESLSWRWRLPPGTPTDQRRRLVAEERREAIFERWTNAPRAALGGKSPRQVVGDAELRIPLLASALVIEQAAVEPTELELFDKLREQLELPPSETINPETVDVSQLSVIRIPHLDLTKLTDLQLMKLLQRSAMHGGNLAALAVASELVSRTSHDPETDLTPAFRQLVQMEPDLAKAQEWVERARKWSKSKNQSVAEWALMDLEIAIQRGNSTQAQAILDEIRSNHINEPGIAEATYRLLYSAGLISPRANRSTPTPLAMPANRTDGSQSPASRSGLWTPGGSEDAQTATEGKSAIWTP
jgi:tetratricopeptide (TPR) repeat protein